MGLKMKSILLTLLLFVLIAFFIYIATDAKWYVYVPIFIGVFFTTRIPLLIGGIIFALIPNPQNTRYKQYIDNLRKDLADNPPLTNIPDAAGDRWVLARPIPYYCFKYRLRQAWDVLRYKADAFYYHEQ